MSQATSQATAYR